MEEQKDPIIVVSSEPEPSTSTGTQSSYPDRQAETTAWRNLVIFLLAANIVAVIGPTILWLVIYHLSSNGASGLEFVAIPLVPVFFVGFIVLLFNATRTFGFVKKYHPSGSRKLIAYSVGIASLLVAATLVGWTVLGSRHSSDPKFTSSQVTTEESALTLISSCQLKGISFAEQLDQHTKQNAENSSTGLVVARVGSSIEPHTLFVADREAETIKAAAQASQAKCRDTKILLNSGAKLDTSDTRYNWLVNEPLQW